MSVFNYQGNSVIESYSSNGNTWVKVYNDTGGSLTNGAIKLLTEKWISGKGVVLVPAAIATNATTSNIIGIIDNSVADAATIADSAYGWALVKGLYGSLSAAYGVTTSGTVAANDQLEILNATTVFIDSGNDGGAVWLDESCALAVELVTTNVWAVYLPGRPHTIAAS